jgi:D-arginine dehydrogenase
VIAVDVAVVGAGIIGCLVARELISRNTDLRIVVLDRDAVGSGASRRSAGLHFPRGHTARVRRMSGYSHDYYNDFLLKNPDAPIYPFEAALISSRPAVVGQAYLDVAGLSPTDCVPADIVLPTGMTAWNGSGFHYAEVGALAAMLARELRPEVEVWEGTAVTSLTAGADQATLQLSSGETIVARTVVLAPGPWLAHPAWSALTDQLHCRIKKVVALHVDKTATANDPVIVMPDEDAFLMPMPARNQWLFSYTSTQWHVDPDELTGSLTPVELTEAHRLLSRYAPDLVARTRSGRVFCDAYSPDREPIVRALDAQERIVFTGAANGSGYRLGPAIAAEAITLLEPHLTRNVL